MLSLALLTPECAANWNKILSYMNLCMCSLARITAGMTLGVTYSAPTVCLHLAVAELELREVVWTCVTAQELSLSCCVHASFLHLC